VIFGGLVCDLQIRRLRGYSPESTLPKEHLASQSERALLPKFLLQLVGGRVWRYSAISVQSRALLPATCTISFKMCGHSCAKFVMWLQMPLIVVEFFALLLVLRIQHVILVSVLRRFKRNLFIFSRNCLTTTNFVRRLITSIWCRPRSRKLPYFKNGKYVHFIFCRYLSSISVFAVPSCSLVEFNNQQESGRDFLNVSRLCAHLFSNDNLSCLGSYDYFKLAFYGSQYSGCFYLQYSHLQQTLVHEGASLL